MSAPPYDQSGGGFMQPQGGQYPPPQGAYPPVQQQPYGVGYLYIFFIKYRFNTADTGFTENRPHRNIAQLWKLFFYFLIRI